ncbi:hypothetical protein [Opitutus sp. GAS368]|jgi:hypothetical protein|uniref:hypothetical protein n=1 Tax=Opitutus sp. GAS368 TaxID=1882749 RepID=UPI00087B1A31|nr:hypothetical protein [Opitutus sp. GAS368]SDR84569.1 hypothetical protein SAMN05444173_1093 [Opitutus sp. GAS368]
MKTPLLAVVFLFCTSLGSAQPVFPGLKAVLSTAEWQRAGLDRLTPDEIGVIDAALIRHEAGATARLQADLTATRAAAATVPAATPAVSAEQKRGLLQRFGLPVFSDTDWRTLPPLKARVLAWESANRFKLDNGQIWEGYEAIPYELVGKDIEIQARPHGQFALIVEGANTTIRVMRLR